MRPSFAAVVAAARLLGYRKKVRDLLSHQRPTAKPAAHRSRTSATIAPAASEANWQKDRIAAATASGVASAFQPLGIDFLPMWAAGHEVLVVGPPSHQTAQFGSDGGFLTKVRAALPRAVAELVEFAYSFIAFARLCRAWRRFRPDALYERYNLYMLAGAWLKGC